MWESEAPLGLGRGVRRKEGVSGIVPSETIFSKGRFWSSWRIEKAIEGVLNDWHRSEDIVPDASMDYIGIKVWPWTERLYTLIEQGFKQILGRYPNTHHLKLLFDKLDENKQAVLRDGYQDFWNFHPVALYPMKGYPRKVEEFLERLDESSRKKSSGQIDARYLPLEGDDPSKRADPSGKFPFLWVEGMIELARLCREILLRDGREGMEGRIPLFGENAKSLVVDAVLHECNKRSMEGGESEDFMERCDALLKDCVRVFGDEMQMILDTLRDVDRVGKLREPRDDDMVHSHVPKSLDKGERESFLNNVMFELACGQRARRKDIVLILEHLLATRQRLHVCSMREKDENGKDVSHIRFDFSRIGED